MALGDAVPSSDVVATPSSAFSGHAGRPSLGSRFLVSVLAFQRTKQLEAGAPPRVDRREQKFTSIALREVLADTISWSTA